MTDLFLIAHRVHGLPAFDVATQMECPECDDYSTECIECEGFGYWWIVPTSGHRAYPYWHTELNKLKQYFYSQDGQWTDRFDLHIPAMPPGLPDHYPHHSAPSISLAEALGIRPKPAPPIIRRF